MASLYKKPVLITDPRTGKRIKAKSKKWWGRYRDENGEEIAPVVASRGPSKGGTRPSIPN